MSPALAWRGVVEEYRDYLPVNGATPVVTLLEGGTPLVPAPRLSARVEADVWLKLEGANPTGSFKDRGMTVAISKALEEGAKAVVCGSTGNTSASAAAYAARAGLTCAVLIPDGYIALGKLAQALVHGARVVQVRGNFDRALELVRELAATEPVTVVNSINPYRIEGQKTGAFEVVDALGDAPDVHCIPVGNAGNITAYWRGYREYQDAGKVSSLPRMFGFQAAGAAPIVLGHPVEKPETIATAIRIGQPGVVVRGYRRSIGVRGPDRRRRRRRHPRGLPVLGPRGVRILRAGVSGLRSRAAQGGCARRQHGGVYPHRARFEGPGRGHRPDRRAQGSRGRPGGREGGAGPLGRPPGAGKGGFLAQADRQAVSCTCPARSYIRAGLSSGAGTPGRNQ